MIPVEATPVSVTDRTLSACSLRPGPWPPAPGTCIWCGAALVGRQRRWCSRDCEQTFTANHQWASARAAAVKRDGGACTSCGVAPDRVAAEIHAWGRLVDALTRRPVTFRDPEMAWNRHQETWAEWRQRVEAIEGPWLRANTEVQTWLTAFRLEVNHRTPILGRHGQFGCHHHLDGLETLCHTCHLEVTAEQFGYKRKAEPSLSLFEAVA